MKTNGLWPKQSTNDNARTRTARWVNNNEINFVVTSLYGFFTVYVALISLFQRDIFRPFDDDEKGVATITTNTTTIRPHVALKQQASANSSVKNSLNATTRNAAVAGDETFAFPVANGGGGVFWREKLLETPTVLLEHTVISLLALLFLAQVLGYVAHRLRLPSLFGMLLAGIIFANVYPLSGTLSIHKTWATVVRQLAFLLCLIRSGIGLDPQRLRACWLACVSIALISATGEMLAILLVAYFGYALPLGLATLFAYIMAANSPAVTIPLMLQFQAAGRGTHNGIPTLLLSGVAVDNVYCVMAYFALAASIFVGGDDPSSDASSSWTGTLVTVARVCLQLVGGVICGMLAGLVLRYLPQPYKVGINEQKKSHEQQLHHEQQHHYEHQHHEHQQEHHYEHQHHEHQQQQHESVSHFTRSLLLATSCCALFFGAYALRCDVAAPAGVFAACIVAASRWKSDNRQKTLVEERVFKILWDYIFLPLLFALTGALFHVSLFSWEFLGGASVTLFIGILARMLAAFGVAHFCEDFNLKEKIFVAVSFTPKATVQAVFLPFLVAFADDEHDARYIALSCALSILVAAPLAHFAMEMLGRAWLSKSDRSDVDGELAHDSMGGSVLSSSTSPTRTKISPIQIDIANLRSPEKTETNASESAL